MADRYSDSTVAYQGYGRGLPIKDVNVVNGLAVQGVIPDLTFFFGLSSGDRTGESRFVPTPHADRAVERGSATGQRPRRHSFRAGVARFPQKGKKGLPGIGEGRAGPVAYPGRDETGWRDQRCRVGARCRQAGPLARPNLPGVAFNPSRTTTTGETRLRSEARRPAARRSG